MKLTAPSSKSLFLADYNYLSIMDGKGSVNLYIGIKDKSSLFYFVSSEELLFEFFPEIIMNQDRESIE